MSWKCWIGRHSWELKPSGVYSRGYGDATFTVEARQPFWYCERCGRYMEARE